MKKLFGIKTSQFEKELLEEHNAVRREHGVQPLSLAPELSRAAQRTAERLASLDELQSEPPAHGQNVYRGQHGASARDARDAVRSWCAGIEHFSFGREPEPARLRAVAQFTQLVWRDTRQLGAARARSSTGNSYVVCAYGPPGNRTGQFGECVPPPGAGALLYGPRPAPAPAPPPGRRLHEMQAAHHDEPDEHDEEDEPGEEDEAQFEQECLEAHNEYRARHGVPPLRLDRQLCRYAAEWARYLSERGQLTHRRQTEYGENLYYQWSSERAGRASGREAVDKWYSEIAQHAWGAESEAAVSGAGHFTQVVWRASQALGVAGARAQDGALYVVANYSPPGNILGKFTDNVPPPLTLDST